MTNFFILYWKPGSAGDLIQNLLCLSEEFSGFIDKFVLDSNGRSIPIVDSSLEYLMTGYHKEWDSDSCAELTNTVRNTENFIIPTQRLDQVRVLKTNLKNSKSVGITFPKNMSAIVLKNWCKKVMPDDVDVNHIYSSPLHEYFKERKIFGEFILKERLKFDTECMTPVDSIFDINISLEKFYINDLSDISALAELNTQMLDFFNQWLEKQSILHKFRYNINPSLESALGFNSLASKQSVEDDIPLDVFDNILIKHIYPKAPKFNTLKTADYFINSLFYDN